MRLLVRANGRKKKEEEEEEAPLNMGNTFFFIVFLHYFVPDAFLTPGYIKCLSAESFTWPQRIKTVLCFARLLEFLHGQAKPYLLLNINAAHIVLDQVCQILLFLFNTETSVVLLFLVLLLKPLPPVFLCFAFSLFIYRLIFLCFDHRIGIQYCWTFRL